MLIFASLALLATSAGWDRVVTAEQYVEAFQSICLQGFGDLKHVKAATKAYGFRRDARTALFPNSYYAKKSEISLVYRGTLDDVYKAYAPQCSIQIHSQVSDEQYEAFERRIEKSLHLPPGNRESAAVDRATSWPYGQLRIVLAREVLGTDPQLRLGVQPAPDACLLKDGVCSRP